MLSNEDCLQRPRSGRDGSRRLVLPCCVAVGILAASASISALFPIFSDGRPARDGLEVADVQDTKDPQQPGSFHLINPHDGVNHTDPAQTTTIMCTQQFDLPVLAGADVVSYFSLEEGELPAFGTETLMAVHENYRYYFSTIENLWKFEVRGRSHDRAKHTQ